MSVSIMPSPVPSPCETAILDSAELCSALSSPQDSLKICRALLNQANAFLQAQFLADAPVDALVRARAAHVDQLLLHVWANIWPEPAQELALIAVGGYGRGELHPGSDIDLLILLAGDASVIAPGDLAQQRIEQFLTFLWDIGLEVGHSVRTISDCVREAIQDITVVTSLMEARLLTGAQPVFQAMCLAVAPTSIWPTREFFAAKSDEQSQRHHKYNDTAYNLEPNIKEAPGGLRDIQTIGWVAKRHFGTASLYDLVSHDFLTEAEFAALIEGQNFLWRIRFALHILAGRREDRLLFDYQRALAKQFGYQDTGERQAVEQFMKQYYRTVMEIDRHNEMLLQLFQEAIVLADQPQDIVPINKRFQARNHYLEATHDQVFTRYPFALLEIFVLLAEHGELAGVRATTIRLIRDHRYLINDKFRADLRCRSLFMALLRQSDGITRELRRMNGYGVLAAYLPVFGKIVGQMQHDLFHVYTVDEHTLFLVRNLRRFALPEYAHEFPLCSEVFQRIPKAEILYLAGLFHDIAKGRGGDHSELGATDAMDFCLHHGLSQYDARLVSWLVKNHLVMSSTAQRQDISDPEVVTAFAMRMGDQARLNYLYLLTVADIRATNPAMWNGWKASLLAELYLASLRALRRGLHNPVEQAERIQENQSEALRLLCAQDLDEQALMELWSQLSEDYFLRYSSDEISWHTRAILAAPHELPLILVRDAGERGTEVFIHARDEDYLFAATTTQLAQIGLTVLDARIITTLSAYTMNTFIVLEDSGQAINNPHRLEEISAALRQCLLQTVEQCARQPLNARLMRRARRQIKHFSIPTEVIFTQDERTRRTIMEVIANDRPGLLSIVSKAFMACGIRLQNARIATFGARVEDIFFITDRDNLPVTDIEQQARLRETISGYLSE